MYIDGKNVLKINNRVSAKFIPVNFWFPTRQTYLAPTDLLIFWTFSKRQTYLGRHDYSELRSNQHPAPMSIDEDICKRIAGECETIFKLQS